MLRRDTRWEIFYGDIALEDFAEKMPRAYFKKEVNEQVKHAFEIVHKLLLHAYYEYLFIDVAVTRAFHILEMAFVIRYKELNNGNEWDLKKRPLVQLIDWFNSRSYFEINDKDFLNHVRSSRNSLSHLKGHHFGGTVTIHWIGTISDLINDLYEDTQLRKARWTKTTNLYKDLKMFLRNGGKLKLMEITYLIYEIGYCAVDNRTADELSYFSLLPVFDVTSTEIKRPLVFSYHSSLLKMAPKKIDLSVGAGKVVLTNDLTSEEQNMVLEFRKRVNSDEHFRAHNFSFLFDAENSIRDALRKATPLDY